MTLNVSGKKIQVGEYLTKHAEEELSKIIEKYYGKHAEANVIISKDANLYKTEITVYLRRGIVLHSDDDDEEAYVSFDNAARKLAKQLRKHKEVIRSRKNKVSEFTVRPNFPLENTHDFYGDASVEPVLIADVIDEVPSLSVAEAQDALINSSDVIKIFRNKSTNKINIVYWRKDSNIGWVDAE